MVMNRPIVFLKNVSKTEWSCRIQVITDGAKNVVVVLNEECDIAYLEKCGEDFIKNKKRFTRYDLVCWRHKSIDRIVRYKVMDITYEIKIPHQSKHITYGCVYDMSHPNPELIQHLSKSTYDVIYCFLDPKHTEYLKYLEHASKIQKQIVFVGNQTMEFLEYCAADSKSKIPHAIYHTFNSTTIIIAPSSLDMSSISIPRQRVDHILLLTNQPVIDLPLHNVYDLIKPPKKHKHQPCVHTTPYLIQTRTPVTIISSGHSLMYLGKINTGCLNVISLPNMSRTIWKKLDHKLLQSYLTKRQTILTPDEMVRYMDMSFWYNLDLSRRTISTRNRGYLSIFRDRDGDLNLQQHYVSKHDKNKIIKTTYNSIHIKQRTGLARLFLPK